MYCTVLYCAVLPHDALIHLRCGCGCGCWPLLFGPVELGWLLEYLSCLAPLCSAQCVADKLPLSLKGSGQHIGWMDRHATSLISASLDVLAWLSLRSFPIDYNTTHTRTHTHTRTQPLSFTGTLTACWSKTQNPRAQKRRLSEHVGPFSSGLFICGPRIFPSESLMRPLCDPRCFRRRHCAVQAPKD